jgi:hypothetical protein
MDKARSGERMKLGAFFHPTGNHVAAWLHPDAQIDAGTNFRHYAEITQTAEGGKFDLMFVADAVATRDGKLEALSRWPQYMAYFDPLTLLPARSCEGIVGQLGRRCVCPRPQIGTLLRPGQAPLLEPQGRAFLGSWPAECRAAAARPSGALPSRLVRGWPRGGSALR